VGLQRLVRGLADLRDVLPDRTPYVVVNRVRKGPINGEPRQQITAALSRYAGIDDVTLVPYDRAGFDKAMASGRSLAEVAADSPAREALLPLAAHFAGIPAATPRRRGKRRSA
jgi:Flp pilus assembly CpaE family ATPase